MEASTIITDTLNFPPLTLHNHSTPKIDFRNGAKHGKTP